MAAANSGWQALVLGLTVLCIAGTAQAADYGILWSTSPNTTIVTAVCGDTITLTWSGTHDVARATTGTCPTTGFTSLTDTTSGGTYKYTVKSTDTTFWLICTVAGHCAGGQNVKVTATCPTTNVTTNGTTTNTTTTNTTTPVYDSVVPKTGGANSYYTMWRVRKINDLKITCADDVLFYWNSTGTLFKHSLLMKPFESFSNMNDSCTDLEVNNSTKLQLVPQSTIGNYTWQPKENGDYLFVCQVGQHCLNGQRIRVSVTGCSKTSSIYKPGGVSAISSPSPSPSSSPKKSYAALTKPFASWLLALCALTAFWSG